METQREGGGNLKDKSHKFGISTFQKKGMDLLIGFVIWIALLGIVIWRLFKHRKASNSPKYKTCPSCLEQIKQEAKVCEFCGWVHQEKMKQRVKPRKKKVLNERDPQRDKLF